MRLFLKIFFFFTLTIGALFAEVSDVELDFIRELSESSSYTQAELIDLFDEVQVNQSVLDKISNPSEKRLDWIEYKNIFLTEERLKAAKVFYRDYKQTLERAEMVYGVPSSIILSILGVETYFGKILGKHSVFESLYTLGFHYPPRSKFFRSELRHFLILAKQENWDVFEPKGSYAGAMGYGQFISSSYISYAVDFNKDGQIDLFNPEDAIGSIANYFKKNGWKTSQPVIADAYISKPISRSFLNQGLKPAIPYAEIKKRGLLLSGESSIKESDLMLPLYFDGEKIPFQLGLHNFYVITRYNHSRMYAYVVWLFSRSVQDMIL